MEMITILKTEYDALKANNAHLEQQLSYLLEQMRLARHKQFGSSSEKSKYDCDQLNLFNEVEVFATPEQDEPVEKEIAGYTRRLRKELPSKLPENLPVEVVEHALPKDEQVCGVCNESLHVMGREVIRRELKLIPAKAVIVEHVQLTYACRNCEKNDTSVPVQKAALPNPVISGSFASPEAIAHIISQKFIMGIPLYRQEQEWKRQGIALSRQTMSNWLLKATELWLNPLYEALKRQLLQHEVLHTDESTLQVLNEPGKKAQSKSYMWLYRTGSDAEFPIALYEYQSSRKAEHPQCFLEGWQGYLHTDGYAGYHSLPEEVTVVGCWAHSRRTFDEALKAIPEKEREDSNAAVGKAYCDRLFAFEKQWAKLTEQERLQQRQAQAKPVLDEFLSWLNYMRDKTGKSALGKAVRYTLGQWRYLECYLLDGRLEISNNRAERSIKPFVIGRKNFLFANTPSGAKTSAILYSMVETAKENGLNPFEYLTWLFQELPKRLDWKPDDFLPSGGTIPEQCFCPKPRDEKYAWEED